MLSTGRENFLGKLLLSSALVAVSLAYGVWQRHQAVGPAVAMAPRPIPLPMTSTPFLPAPPAKTAPASATPAAAAKPDSGPDTGFGPDAGGISRQAAPKSAIIARATPQADTSAAASPQQDAASLAPPAPLMILPTDDVSPPIPLVTGTPAPGVTPSIPASAGTHLLDGDYVSDRHQLEWGDLRVKISVHGGQITGVQILQYPDHRSRSLDLSLMAGPTLESEVIKTQHAQVDAVSSATDTSYAFQDTIADVIVKAARE